MILNFANESASYMYVQRNLGQASAIRPNDEIWGIQEPYLQLICATVL